MKFVDKILYENVGGIYCILNTVNGKFYIGSTKNFFTRYKQHKNSLMNGIHHSIYLQRAIEKHGIENFEFHVLCVAKDNLLQLEQRYLSDLCPANRGIGYNVEGSVNYRSIDTIDKIVATRKRNGNSEKFKAHLASLSGKMRGRVQSNEEKLKKSIALVGRVRTDQHRLNNGRSIQKPILAFDWLGYPVAAFDSLNECAKHYGVNKSTVCEPIKAGRPYRGVHLVYLQKELS